MDYQLPNDFLNEMRVLLGNEFEDFLRSYNQPPTKAFRINSVKPCTFNLSAYGNERVPYTDNCYYLKDDSLGGSVFHHAGAVYIQEPSAMIPALVLNPKKGFKVLDLCAAPGGKTGQLAEMIGDNGLLVSNEIDNARNKILVSNVERLGLRNTIVTRLSPQAMAEMAYGWFDAVLVDAPCSGEGMFRKNPDAIKEWSLSQSKSSSETQKKVLLEGAKCVREGGLLVYSTCTFSKRENEEIVECLVNTGKFKLLAIPDTFPVSQGLDEQGLCGRLYPHKIKGEGHFVALLQKISECKTANSVTKLKLLNNKANNKELELAKPFLENVEGNLNYVISNNALIVPPAIMPPQLSFGITSFGVKVGTIEKRLIPHHQFFSAYGTYFKNKVELSSSDERVKKFLRGEEIPVDNNNGWGVVTVDGCPLGGVKITDRIAKNHYPKGLRALK